MCQLAQWQLSSLYMKRKQWEGSIRNHVCLKYKAYIDQDGKITSIPEFFQMKNHTSSNINNCNDIDGNDEGINIIQNSHPDKNKVNELNSRNIPRQQITINREMNTSSRINN